MDVLTSTTTVCVNQHTLPYLRHFVLYPQCSNLMLVESIPKEPHSFHVIPFDNTKLQYTLQVSSSVALNPQSFLF